MSFAVITARHVGLAVAIAASALIDRLAPLGMTSWILYLIPVWWSAFLTRKRISPILATAGVCCLLIAVGSWPSPSGFPAWIALANRFSGMLVIVIVAVLLQRTVEGRDEFGRIVRWYGMTEDVHDHKVVEMALRESEERFRSMADGTPMIIWVTDCEGRIQFINRAYCEFFGTTVQEVRQGGWQPLVHPDDAPTYVDGFFDALRKHTPFHAEARVRRADGRWRWIESHGQPRRTCTGEYVGFAGSSMDMTDRKKAEEALRASEERLRLAMTASHMGAWDIDLTTGGVTWNAKQHELFGRPLDQPVETLEAFYALVYPDDVQDVKRASAAAELTGRFSREFRIIRPDGQVRWIAGHGATVMDPEGRAVRMVGVNYDVTEHKEAQARLEHFAEELERQVAVRTQELMESQDRLRALATELNLAEQRERKRLAAELHDYLAQMLVLAKLKLGQSKRLVEPLPVCAELIRETDEVLTESLTYTRTLVHDLTPPVLHDFGLPTALRWLSERMKRHELRVELDIQ